MAVSPSAGRARSAPTSSLLLAPGSLRGPRAPANAAAGAPALSPTIPILFGLIGRLAPELHQRPPELRPRLAQVSGRLAEQLTNLGDRVSDGSGDHVGDDKERHRRPEPLEDDGQERE